MKLTDNLFKIQDLSDHCDNYIDQLRAMNDAISNFLENDDCARYIDNIRFLNDAMLDMIVKLQQRNRGIGSLANRVLCMVKKAPIKSHE